MHRVVITGLGVVAPNGNTIHKFTNAIKNGESGITYVPRLKELNFGCCIGGISEIDTSSLSSHLKESKLMNLKNTSITYGLTAALEAWLDAGLQPTPELNPADVDTGCIFGSGFTDMELSRFVIDTVNSGNVKMLGPRLAEQMMNSGVSAYIGGMLGLGNHVYSNSAACSTGTESLVMASRSIKHGYAKRMVVGSCDSYSPYTWGMFDSMRVLCRSANETPISGSRPMSKYANGFVPGAGAACMILESLESAIKRKAHIYAEIAGGSICCGGQRQTGTMTAPNSYRVSQCIEEAIVSANEAPANVDLICGHLSSTFADKVEIANWSRALNRSGSEFPFINSLKSMTGHCLSAAGIIESVAAVLQLHHQFIHPNLNCEELNPEILELIDESRIVRTTTQKDISVVMKASFGFGDVNSCIVLKKIKNYGNSLKPC
ncbi:3-oxoacyl-(acyl-carrier-protein) synthase [Pedobacter terrae]|uniref:3-oxoacyl-[acyl-carrier-protein] synthase 1 n=1 Tax=Pedobacter terrae TaxID=405671 RepID=A0A1G8EK07_9SPHI|nr:beta-ketoacyl-[acyl-carrier-protein] synthase family protein [Pedobacter terrae]SDH70283.1 3-oxoacyl-(acyl-carrier-protein) synthase [Pedobacter terrae]